MLDELCVLLATAVDQKNDLAVHLGEDVRESVPQGELAPCGESVFAAAEMQHDHLAALVAEPPIVAARIA